MQVMHILPDEEGATQQKTRVLADSNSPSFNETFYFTVTPQQVADYQISIWGSVFVVVAFIVPVWAFFNMDTSSDSILYRIAGPRLS